MRLIDAEILKKRLPKELPDNGDDIRYQWGEYHDGWNNAISYIKDEIETVNTIEAEPVRHGYWDYTSVAFYRKCSECGATIKNPLYVFLDYDIRGLHYCPNCGAKMDSNDSNDSNALNALEMDEVNDDN